MPTITRRPLALMLQVRFEWRMEFNGWHAEKTEEWDEELFPDKIDAIVVGYTNSRSFVSMKLKEM